MKRKLLIMALTCVLCVFLCFGGCENVSSNSSETNEKTVVVTISYPEYENSFTATGKFVTAQDVLNALVQNDEGFTFTASNGDYGLFITEVCGYTVSGNEFWGIYTDTIKTDDKGLPNVYEEYTTVIGDKTFYSCASGVSGQPVFDGENLLLVVGSY